VRPARGRLREAVARHPGDPTAREKLAASKKERVVNRVEATPTICIDDRRRVGDLEIGGILDAVFEEFDRVGGRQWHTR